MSFDDISEPIKSCLWLDTAPFSIPQSVLKNDPVGICQRVPIKFGYLEDDFELYLIKLTKSDLEVVFSRTRQNTSEKTDDGYILQFYFTVVGFDEETKVEIMKPDQEQISATFVLSDATLAKLNSTNYLFELMVVVKILEISSLDEDNDRKRITDGFMSFLKDSLTDEAVQHLSCILKRPGLEDVFTGRMPFNHLKGVMNVIVLMSKDLAKISEYINAKWNNNDSVTPDFDVSQLLHYIALGDKENPVPHDIAVQQYLIAHKLGLDFYKLLTSEFLMTIMEEDNIVLNILEAALFVQDKDLFDKAIFCFLNNFHQIIRSEYFKEFSLSKGFVARLIIHAARVWVTNNGRQDYDFAAMKSSYIKRTAAFSREIANYMRAKDQCTSLPAIDLGLILNYILNEEQSSISNKDLIKVYFEAHHMGLNYLVDLSRDCILERIGDKNFVINAVQAAECVNDEILFEKCARNFQNWEKEILNSERWLEMLKYSNTQCRFIMYSLKRFQKKESCNHAETGEALESSSFKIF